MSQSESPRSQPIELTFGLPAEAIAAIAERVAELLAEQLEVAAQASPWMTIAEAAAYLRCDPQRIYDLRSKGALSRLTEGGRALVSRDEVEALVEGARAA